MEKIKQWLSRTWDKFVRWLRKGDTLAIILVSSRNVFAITLVIFLIYSILQGIINSK